MYNLYFRKCKKTWEKIISIFSEDKKLEVYNLKTWWGDSWSPNFQEYDFNDNFNNQFEKLLYSTPIPSLFANFKEDVNSDYTNFAWFDKNCYMIFHADFNEDCAYATWLKNSKNCFDSLNVFDCENTYQCINCIKSYWLKYSQDCNNCSESYFLKDCIGCNNCFSCVWLQNKSYCIFNEQKTKEEYLEFIKNINTSNNSELQKLIQDFSEYKKWKVNKAFHWLENENCFWDHIFNSKNVINCFDVHWGRDMKYCERIYNWPNEDCYDVDQFWANIKRIYETSVIWVDSESVMSAIISYNTVNIYYSIFTFNCKDCFWCVWLKNKQYCILNKQYTKEEYEELVPKIIEHMKQTWEWWEFFPSSISPFGYNETVANEYYLVSKEEAISKWFNWSDYEKPLPKVDKIIPASKLPENISDIPDDILNWAIECEVTKKPFRIISQELEFYRKHNLPIPRKHLDQRHKERMELRNPRKLFDRKCDKCKKKILIK